MKLILASGSPRRRELLERFHIPFTVMPSDTDEDFPPDAGPEQVCTMLAERKAAAVAAEQTEDVWVLGADTIVFKNEILGKPADTADAMKMLKSLRGGWHTVWTGVSLVSSSTGERHTKGVCTRVHMKEVSDDFLHDYIRTGEPMDKAGAYGIQGYASMMVDAIEGCFFNVMGLPVSELADMLSQSGFQIIGNDQ